MDPTTICVLFTLALVFGLGAYLGIDYERKHGIIKSGRLEEYLEGFGRNPADW